MGRRTNNEEKERLKKRASAGNDIEAHAAGDDRKPQKETVA